MAKVPELEVERVALEWKLAFQKAHNKAPPAITWDHGWFTVHHSLEWNPRYRRATVEAMTRTLRRGFTN